MNHLIKPYTKPVIKEPYYDCPIWIENKVIYKEYISLTADSKKEDVELFLVHLFGYNNIDVKQSLEESFNELFKEDEVAILGGVAFFESQNKLILPSCCCGLEDWSEVYYSVKNRISPWLGHDPNPGMTYRDKYVRVWSDDPSSTTNRTREAPYYIEYEYEYEVLLRSLEKTKDDLEGFIKDPLFIWISRRDNTIGNLMTQKMEQWFMK